MGASPEDTHRAEPGHSPEIDLVDRHALSLVPPNVAQVVWRAAAIRPREDLALVATRLT
jgi:hypothetical protein